MVFSTLWTQNSQFFTYVPHTITPLQSLRSEIEDVVGPFDREVLGLSRMTFDCLATLEQAASVEEMRLSMAIPGFEYRLSLLIDDVYIENDYQTNIWCLYLLLIYSHYTGCQVKGRRWGPLIQATSSGPYHSIAKRILDELYGYLDAEALECSKASSSLQGSPELDEKHSLELLALAQSSVMENHINRALPLITKLLQQGIFFLPGDVVQHCKSHSDSVEFVEAFLKIYLQKSDVFRLRHDDKMLDFIDSTLPALLAIKEQSKEIYQEAYKPIFTAMAQRSPDLYRDPRVIRIDKLGLQRPKQAPELQQKRFEAADAFIDAKNFTKALSTLSHITMEDKELLQKRYERIFEWIDVSYAIKLLHNADFRKRISSLGENCHTHLLEALLQRAENTDHLHYLLRTLLKRGIVNVPALENLHLRSPNFFLSLKELLLHHVSSLSRRQRQALQFCALEVEEPFAIIVSASEWKTYFRANSWRHFALVSEYGFFSTARIKKEVINYLTVEWRRRLHLSDGAYCYEWLGIIGDSEKKARMVPLLLLFIKKEIAGGATHCLIEWARDDSHIKQKGAAREIATYLLATPVASLPIDVWLKLLAKEWDAESNEQMIACGERLLSCKLKKHVNQLIHACSRMVRTGSSTPNLIRFVPKALQVVVRYKNGLSKQDEINQSLSELFSFYRQEITGKEASEGLISIALPLARHFMESNSPLSRDLLAYIILQMRINISTQNRASLESFTHEFIANTQVPTGQKALLLDKAIQNDILDQPLISIKALPRSAKKVTLYFLENWLLNKKGKFSKSEQKLLTDIFAEQVSFCVGADSLQKVCHCMNILEDKAGGGFKKLINSWRRHVVKILFMPRLGTNKCYIEPTDSPTDRGFQLSAFKDLIGKCVRGGEVEAAQTYSSELGSYSLWQRKTSLSTAPSFREVAFSHVHIRCTDEGYSRCLIEHCGHIAELYINEQSTHVPLLVKIELFVRVGLLVLHTRTDEDRAHFAGLWVSLSESIRPLLSSASEVEIFPIKTILRLQELYGIENRLGYIKRFSSDVDHALINTVNRSQQNGAFIRLLFSTQMDGIIARSSVAADPFPLMMFLSSFFIYQTTEILSLAFSRCIQFSKGLDGKEKKQFKKIVFAKDVIPLTNIEFLKKWKEQINSLNVALTE